MLVGGAGGARGVAAGAAAGRRPPPPATRALEYEKEAGQAEQEGKGAVARVPTQFKAGNVFVRFPFEPYACQRRYISEVVAACNAAQNALLESPTGTGKTLSLLCATLAWQKGHAYRRAKVRTQNELAVQQWEAAASAAENAGVAAPPPPSLSAGPGPRRKASLVIYASRTHAQLKQVVRELQSTQYRPSVSILGSRDQLCVEPRYEKLKGPVLNRVCSTAVSARACQFRNNLEDFLAVSENKRLVTTGTHQEAGLQQSTDPTAAAAAATAATATTTATPTGTESVTSTAATGRGRGEIMDIEDLVRIGKQRQVCPYYLTRETLGDAELVLLPYNYLLDPTVRDNMHIDWTDSVIIFDEAHNLDSVACEAASFDISTADLARAMTELDTLIRAYREGTLIVPASANESGSASSAFGKSAPNAQQRAVELQRGGSGNGSGSGSASASGGGGGSVSTKDIFHATVATKRLLKLLEEAVDSTVLDQNGARTLPGDAMMRMLNSAGLTPASVTVFQAQSKVLVDSVIDTAAFNSGSTTAPVATPKLAYVCKALVSVFRGRNLSPRECAWLAQRFRVHIHMDTSAERREQQQSPSNGRQAQPGYGQHAQGSMSRYSSQSRHHHQQQQRQPQQQQHRGRILSYWCFSPGIAMRELMTLGVRNVLLTSGTLSPLRSFGMEFELGFPRMLENPHVIDDDQVCVSVVQKGVNGITLNSCFQNRSNAAYLEELATTLERVLMEVRFGGVLVFFPSYSVMDSCIKAWKGGLDSAAGRARPTRRVGKQLWNRLTQQMPVVVEPRGSAELRTTIMDFEDNLRVRGHCCLFAVCRGKVSEGIDFSDEKARCVVLTGIPFPPARDAKVMLKQQYMSEQKQIRQKELQSHQRHSQAGAAGSNAPPVADFIDGSSWYRQQGARAVNQALGRVIRHRHDYGAVLLLDERFANSGQICQLSSWIRPRAQVFDAFDDQCLGNLRTFFRTARQKSRDRAAAMSAAKHPASSSSTSTANFGIAAAAVAAAAPMTGAATRQGASAESGGAAAAMTTARSSGMVVRTTAVPRQQGGNREAGSADPREEWRLRQSEAAARKLESVEVDAAALLALPSATGAGSVRNSSSSSSSSGGGGGGSFSAGNGRDAADTTVTGTALHETTFIHPRHFNATADEATPSSAGAGASSSSASSSTAASAAAAAAGSAAPPPAPSAAEERWKRQQEQKRHSSKRPREEDSRAAHAEGADSELAERPAEPTGARQGSASQAEAQQVRERQQRKRMATAAALQRSVNRHLVKGQQKASSSNQALLVCAVCRSQARVPCVAKNCGHVCCHSCWIKWLAVKKECPCCRKPTRKRDLCAVRVK